MENKNPGVEKEMIENPQVVLVEPENDEGAVGGEIQHEGAQTTNNVQQPTGSNNDVGAKCQRDGAQSPPVPPQDENMDVAVERGGDHLEDEVSPAVDDVNGVIQAMDRLQLQLQEKPDEGVKIQGPPQLQVTLYPHQQHALAWMLWRESCSPAGGILADDMGLGKTVTTIALIIKSLENESLQKTEDSRKNSGGTLIVCPANLMFQWREEIETRGNIQGVNVYHRDGERDITILSQYHVVITSYATLSRNYTQDKILFKIKWNRVVLDEAHVIRNANSLKSQRVAELSAKNRWALTGTPMHHQISDLYPILRFLKLSPFDDMRHFNNWIIGHNAESRARIERILKCIMLRRTKEGLIAAGLLPELPLKTNNLITVVLAPEERIVYDKIMDYSRFLFIEYLLQMEEREIALGPDNRRNGNFNRLNLTPAQRDFLNRRGAVTHHQLLTLILRLRQTCCHQALIFDMLDREDFEVAGIDNPQDDLLREANKEVLHDIAEFDGIIGDVERNLYTRNNPVFNQNSMSSKMRAILKLVQEIINRGDKVVIFSDWVRYLSLIGQHLDDIPGVTYEFYTEATPHTQRTQIIHNFNNSDEIKILLMSLRTGERGLSLTAANHVMLVDVHWDPQLKIQAEDKVYRIGQRKNVFIHTFVCENTIEERILTLQEGNSQIAQDLLAGGVGESRGLGFTEISSLFNV